MQLGFQKTTSVNELAALGVQISIRDTLIRKLQEEEQRKAELAVLEKPAVSEEEGKAMDVEAPLQKLSLMVDQFSKEVQNLQKKPVPQAAAPISS